MLGQQIASRSAPAGAAALATCLCSTAKFSMGGLFLAGGVVALNLHAGLAVVAAGLVLWGLAKRSSGAAARAVLGFGLLAAGYLLAPPAVMSRSAIHTPMSLVGFALTLLGFAALAWAFFAAYPTRKPGAAAATTGSLAAAAGCSCCMATGAMVWLGAAGGMAVPPSPYADGVPFVLFVAVALAGVYRLAGARPMLIALGGATVALLGDEALKPLLADDIERFPRLLVTLAGMGVVMWGVSRAFVQARCPLPAAQPQREPAGSEAALAGV